MGAALNENVEWTNVPANVRRTFKGKKARRILLKANTTVFTLSKHANFHHGAQYGVPVLWSPYKPLKSDPGYDARDKLASASGGGRSRRDVFRGISAYSGSKVGDRYAVAVKLQVPVWGFIGEIEPVGLGATSIKQSGSMGASLPSGLMSFGAVGGASSNTSRNSAAAQSFLQIYIPGLDPGVSMKRIKAHDLIVA
ncbi:MAG TPA: hypothetical protein DCL95_13510 [Rhodospirillaceae bacterium]|nr:hypothetical protein [Rhodospirillaceae bacterium]MAX62953.1 hypothetical protein [Rhodospirillaceae bacterium]MBB57800.1 hypothetical protein [Rhodospirillaceae bacterium]HAJ21052.1 hypothetical protein [Rhodospirillaceae bacterium]HBM13496.1 hypothetical protein [Rhodospirillaceae bacterium]|tara:strand:+ start:1499 stop:2086 length:588 start_codon:yes stop_codon:yes gene_type:complete